MILFASILLAGCVQTDGIAEPAVRLLPSGFEPESIQPGFDRAMIERDLLLTARNRLGEATVRRALAADSYIFAKYYPGMMPPPPPDAGPEWRPPEFPFALIFRENGQWQRATPDAARLANAGAIMEVVRLLADPAFARQPQWASPGCTDAGASLALIRIERGAETVRRGSCGETELTERLVSFALKT